MVKPKVRDRPVEILLVEDSLSDAQLTLEVFSELNLSDRLHIVKNGFEALKFLRQQGIYKRSPRPALILLDMNLPELNGKELLAQIKTDPDFQMIPVVVLTTSSATEDILHSYQLHANCYIVKPLNLDEFVASVQSLVHFWLGVVTLPSDAQR